MLDYNQDDINGYFVDPVLAVLYPEHAKLEQFAGLATWRLLEAAVDSMAAIGWVICRVDSGTGDLVPVPLTKIQLILQVLGIDMFTWDNEEAAMIERLITMGRANLNQGYGDASGLVSLDSDAWSDGAARIAIV